MPDNIQGSGLDGNRTRDRSDEELPSAATLGGLQLNISGIIGPAIGGFLLPLIGANWVFTINALCFLLVVLAILQWKRTESPSKLLPDC
jgi:MFS family permease